MMALRWFSTKKHPCVLVPSWQKPFWRDPFDYPLRPIQEVKEEIKNKPPVQRAKIQLVHFYQSDPNRVDMRSQVVKMWIDMKD